MTIEDIMRECNNYFDYDYERADVVIDATAKTITGDFSDVTVVAGQYIRLRDTILNDAVYEVSSKTDSVITVVEDMGGDESCDDAKVVLLAPPKAFLTAVSTILADTDLGAYDGIVSKTEGKQSTSYASANGKGFNWTVKYATSLAKFRRVRFE